MTLKSMHAITRQQQRGIPNDVMDIVLKFGAQSNRPGGALGYFITKADAARLVGKLKKVITLIERAKGVEVIQSHHDETITVYHRN